MALEDKTLTCSDCGKSFTFTVGEQEFYKTKGLQHDPDAVRDCRAARAKEFGFAWLRPKDRCLRNLCKLRFSCEVPSNPRGPGAGYAAWFSSPKRLDFTSRILKFSSVSPEEFINTGMIFKTGGVRKLSEYSCL